MLLRSRAGHIVNMSSANGLRAVLGGHVPHTAYSAAKFAVRGFSEALIHDFRFNAPHLAVSVVMPGHVGSEIMTNSARVLGQPAPKVDAAAAREQVIERWRDWLRDLKDYCARRDIPFTSGWTGEPWKGVLLRHLVSLGGGRA